MKARVRIDSLLVERGLAQSRERAQALILAGQVLANGQKLEKCGSTVAANAVLRLVGAGEKYVSRGGLKLEAALDHFGVNPAGKVSLDVGASTGGFTDCLLQRGAARVVAVDVGTQQLDWRLRRDPRVRSLENTNARFLRLEQVGTLASLAVMDVSFISATLILPALPPLLEPRAEVLVLAKPQFEVGRDQVGKGGIVRDERLRKEAVAKVTRALGNLGFCRLASVESALTGARGNREFFVYAEWRKHPAAESPSLAAPAASKV